MWSYLWQHLSVGETQFVKAKSLLHQRESGLQASQGFPREAAHSNAIILLRYSCNMPSLDHHVRQSRYKSFLRQQKHLLWLHALLLANVIFIITPGRAGYAMNMSTALMRPNNRREVQPQGAVDFYTAVTSFWVHNEKIWQHTQEEILKKTKILPNISDLV